MDSSLIGPILAERARKLLNRGLEKVREEFTEALQFADDVLTKLLHTTAYQLVEDGPAFWDTPQGSLGLQPR